MKYEEEEIISEAIKMLPATKDMFFTNYERALIECLISWSLLRFLEIDTNSMIEALDRLKNTLDELGELDADNFAYNKFLLIDNVPYATKENAIKDIKAALQKGA